MNYFWGNVFDYFKERRLGAIFFTTLAAVMGVAFTGALVYDIAGNAGWWQYWPQILPGTALFFLFLVWQGFRNQRRKRRLSRYKSTPLSHDEWLKARRKLAMKPTFTKR